MGTNEQYKQTGEYQQGQASGQEAYMLCPNLNVDQQVAWAQKDFSESPIDYSTGEQRSNFMMGFASGYYRASQK
jgi:hypothetical protein